MFSSKPKYVDVGKIVPLKLNPNFMDECKQLTNFMDVSSKTNFVDCKIVQLKLKNIAYVDELLLSSKRSKWI